MMPNADPSEFTQVFFGCDADEIAEAVILTPLDKTLDSLKSRADEVRDLEGFNKGFNANIGGTPVSVYDSRIGSPVASDCVYYLRFTPCKKIIYTGMIGALQHQIRIGDLILPTAALRGEGASKYFIEETYPAVADFRLLRVVSSTLEDVYADSDIDIHIGPIYTTDSFAAETKEFLELWRSRNLLGVEMETSAIFTVASVYGMKAAAIHVVSDNPVAKKSFFDPLPESDKKRRVKCEDLLTESLIRLVSQI